MTSNGIDLLGMEEGSLTGDGMGDMGERPLGLLPSDALSLGAPGGDSRNDRSWSEVLRREQDLIIDNIFDFIRDHKPDKHEGRAAMNNLASAIIFTVASRALQIKARDEQLKTREKEVSRELKGDELQKVEDAFDRWSKGNRMQEYLVCIKHRYGFEELERREPEYEEDEHGMPLPVTKGPRWDWYNAGHEMREADREAIFALSAAGYDLYNVKQSRGRLRREANENLAKRLPEMDVSDWRARVMGGKATNLDKLMGGTWLILELVAFGLAFEGEENPHWKHMERMYRGVQEMSARRSGWFRRKQSGGGGGGEDDDA